MVVTILIFDRLTALDAIGPYEVFAAVPGWTVEFVAPKAGPQRTDSGATALVADRGIDEVDVTDVLLVPGGEGNRPLLQDEGLLGWIREIDAGSRYTTSVCTGSLLLGAAGLLRGRRATSHWLYRDQLRDFGAEPVADRVVEDGKLMTAAGVSAGIDLALRLVEREVGPSIAQAVQLAIEYDPQPPFDAGSPEKAPPEVVEVVRSFSGPGDEWLGAQRG